MEKSYGVQSEFNIDSHKATFTNYLEVIIDADGKVMYALPSHQEKLISMACKQLGITRDELNALCPRKYYVDFMRWLCLLTGAMSVWNHYCEYGNPTTKQLGTLRKLKLAGLYRGTIPNLSQDPIEVSLENLLRNPEEPQEDPEELAESFRSALLHFLPEKSEDG